MASGPTVSIEGIEEAVAMLERAPKAIVANAYLKALQAGSNVIRDALEARTPYDPLATANRVHGGRGALRENVKTDIQLDSQFRGGSADIGFGSLGHIALWVEYGHWMVGHSKIKGRRKQLGEVAPQPFMRPATDAAAEPSIDAFADSLRKSMQAGIPGVATEGRAA